VADVDNIRALFGMPLASIPAVLRRKLRELVAAAASQVMNDVEW
jgi:hypothetical protein